MTEPDCKQQIEKATSWQNPSTAGQIINCFFGDGRRGRQFKWGATSWQFEFEFEFEWGDIGKSRKLKWGKQKWEAEN